MKKLIVYIVVLFVIFVAIVTIYFVNDLSNNFKKSDPFQMVLERINKNDTNIPVSNGGVEVGYLVGGKLNSNVANFHFKVYTQNKKFVVYADLIKNDSGQWEILDFEAKEK